MGIDGVIVVDCGCPLRSPGETFRKYQCPDGEGNGTPLQCSCLENPRDGGAWWAAICGVAQSRTRLKWLSSSSSRAQTSSSVIGTSVIEGRALVQFSSVQFSHSVVSDSLQPHELQHARPPCPSPTPGVHSNSHPSSQWCHPVKDGII